MSKAPSSFKEVNVKRLCRAVRAAGIPIGRVALDKATGNINVYPDTTGEHPLDLAYTSSTETHEAA
jgi:hypothetical protein